jgi:hypothetical protein
MVARVSYVIRAPASVRFASVGPRKSRLVLSGSSRSSDILLPRKSSGQRVAIEWLTERQRHINPLTLPAASATIVVRHRRSSRRYVPTGDLPCAPATPSRCSP